jgi:hypothetical protein
MIRDAKCARFSIPNKTFATNNYNYEISKVEKIHINGNQVMIFKHKT